MREFNNFTIIEDSYVKVKNLQVKIPVKNKSSSISFVTDNSELIHLAIDWDEIREFIKWDDWNSRLRMILFTDKNIKSLMLDQFVDWQLNSIRFKPIHTPCTETEIRSFQFWRANQRVEILSGNIKVVCSQYQEVVTSKQSFINKYLNWEG